MEICAEREWVKVSSNIVSRSIKKLKNTDTDNKIILNYQYFSTFLK